MTDTVFIQNGVAQEIFSGKTLKEMEARRHPDLVKAMVEVESGTVEVGDVWNGRAFSKPLPAPSLPASRDPLAELDALKSELVQRGVLTAAATLNLGRKA